MFDNLQGTEIAIIGMAGRFPGAANTQEFWRNLADGVESISFFDDDELQAEGVAANQIADPAYVKARGIVRDAEWFDAAFFRYSPRQAEVMDPQHRLFLECSWEVLEMAGYDPGRYDGAIGVYAGSTMSSYLLENLSTNRGLASSAGGFEIVIANDKDFLATGVSYKLNLKGPSVTVQTSCSTSLVAVHIACQSLLNRECDMALSGGVSIVFPQKAGYEYHEGGTRSPDGHCRAFDAKAGGMVGGSGVGLVLLKRLETALEDGDHIHAVIRGSAVNNDGSVKVGFTAPSVEGQSSVIIEAHQIAGINPETISYIEAHGTGTRLGDPVEIRALTQAFRMGTNKKKFCAIGSVKSNIGHLDVAAGVTGLIKTVLSLKNQRIPASLHFEKPNPEMDLENSPFFVNDKLTDWNAGITPRRAGVSSFGIGGTNAHVVLEEAPLLRSEPSGREYDLLVISAKSATALDQATINLADHLREFPEASLADVSYTLQIGKGVFPYRRVVVCKDNADAVSLLDNPNGKRVSSNTHDGIDSKVGFMFTGQGAQRPNMGYELYQKEEEFRRHMDDCCDALQNHIGLDLRELLYPESGCEDEAARQLNQTQITQPALFAFEYALAQLWIGWGIRPMAMIGHSIGEYTAACLSGVFSLEDAIALVAERGRLMGEMPSGDMLSVPLPESEVRALLTTDLSLAAINGPELCVVSGPTEAVTELEQHLTGLRCAAQRLHTSHAFHSAMMEPAVQPFIEIIRRVQLKPPTVPFISNVTGEWIKPGEATDPSYWAQHLRQTVQFSKGVEKLLSEPDRILLEVGPGTTLRSLTAGHPAKSENTTVLSSLPHVNEQRSDLEHLVDSVGRLWMGGCQPDWHAFHKDQKRLRVPLPTYPFERQRYWIPADNSPSEKQLPKQEVKDWLYEPSWKRSGLKKRIPVEKATWLLFTDELGLGDQVAEMLIGNGSEVIRVSPGKSFSGSAENGFTVTPGRRADYLSLVEELSKTVRVPDRIVHLWSVDNETPYITTPELFVQRQERGFYSLLYLLQALSEGEIAKPMQLTVVTSQAQDVTGDEQLCPDKATVLSAALTIGTEFPNIQCRSVDISIAHSQDVSVQAKNVFSETILDSNDLVVAWRGQYRWLQSFEPLPLASLNEPPKRLRDGGVYLITGGLGGMGLSIAEYVARTVRAKLVLVGRTELPARENWDEVLNHPDTKESLKQKIGGIRAVEESGSEVTVYCADVSDLNQMSTVFSDVETQFGPVRGVVHAAGVPGGGVMLRQTPETVESVFAAKVTGTMVLDQLTNDELDFFVLCSSQASFLGMPGRSEYAAANRFMDVYARYRGRKSDCFVTSINWDTWQEVGMAVQTTNADDGSERRILPEYGLATGQGVDIFSRILSSDAIQVVVAVRGVEQAASDVSRQDVASSTTKSVGRDSKLSFHPRPELESEYEAPRTDSERSLALIWQEVLGIEPVGIHDNYYELGGDSVGGIQVVAKANQSGLTISINHVLQYQTIAELASVASSVAKIDAEQGIVTGPVPLTPIQSWFFERGFAEPQHFNQSVLLEELQPLDPSIVRKVMTNLLDHHDALRMRYAREESGWRQFLANPDDKISVLQIDLTTVPDEEVESAIESAATEVQRGLDLIDGPLVQVARFNLGSNRNARWLVVIHHMAVDNLSWRFLLEDFQTLYQALSSGESFELPPKTVSFQDWSKHLSEHSQSEAVTQELAYWLGLHEGGTEPLPRDFAKGENTYGSKETVSASLTKEETRALLNEVRKGWNAQVNDLLLTATAQAFSNWTGRDSLLVEMEGHGREEFVEGIDASRTAGWFTTLFPVLLRTGFGARPRDAIRSVKDLLHAIPNNGLNYGVLRYLNRKSQQQLNRLPQPEVVFLYLGTEDQTDARSTLFKRANESRGPAHAPGNHRPCLMEIVAGVASDELTVSLGFTTSHHRRTTALSIVEDVIESLRKLIRQCPTAADGPKPSDFPLADLDQHALEQIVREDSQIDDIYPLSPLQQGLLFHSLYDPDSGGYFEQLSCTIEGELNQSAFQRAWQRVIDRHQALRTSFRYQDLDRPMQVVHDGITLPWETQDWRPLSQAEQESRFESLLVSDRERGIELTDVPLMRTSLVQMGDRTFRFVWSYSHLLLDGWSGPLIIREVFNFYEAFCRDEELEVPQPRPYRDYIAWLSRQSQTSAESFWRGQLEGFTVPTPLGGLPSANDSDPDGRKFRRTSLDLSSETTEALHAFARQHRLTLNSVIQGAWALVLGCRSASDDIVFGVSVSGRPPQLDAVDSIVGLFINTLPLRVRLKSDELLLDWLQGIQVGQTQQREYEYTSLVDVHGWSSVPRGTPLFESLLVFKNHPVIRSQKSGKEQLTIRDLHAEDASHYDLTLDVTLRPGFLCRLNYDVRRFEVGAISEILGYLESAINSVVAVDGSESKTVGDILIRTREGHFKQQKNKAKSVSQKKLEKIVRKPASPS